MIAFKIFLFFHLIQLEAILSVMSFSDRTAKDGRLEDKDGPKPTQDKPCV